MIKVESLTKSFIHKGKKNYVFKDITFDIKTGESVALLGGNEAGKSTLLQILGRIDIPDSGKVTKDCSISWPV